MLVEHGSKSKHQGYFKQRSIQIRRGVGWSFKDGFQLTHTMQNSRSHHVEVTPINLVTFRGLSKLSIRYSSSPCGPTRCLILPDMALASSLKAS